MADKARIEPADEELPQERVTMSQPTDDGRMYRYVGTKNLAESEYYRLLSADRRRTLLDIFRESTAPFKLEELAAIVAARERGVTVDDADGVERVAISLRHLHLPMMLDVGIVDELSGETVHRTR